MTPLVDRRAQHASIRGEGTRILAAMLASGRYVLGPELDAFERARPL